MKKTTAASKKYFLKWSPFNFCDRNCERCVEFRDDCSVYQEEIQFKLKCVIENKDPNDQKVIFEHIGAALSGVLAIIEEKLKEDGIEISKIDIDELEKEEMEKEKMIKNNLLVKKSKKLVQKINKFFEIFDFVESMPSFVAVTLQKNLEEIGYYASMIPVKLLMAIFFASGDKINKRNKSRGDFLLVSASLSFHSLIAVRHNLENIKLLLGKDQMIWNAKINEIVKNIDIIEKEFKQKFVGIENSRDLIIFHGTLS